MAKNKKGSHQKKKAAPRRSAGKTIALIFLAIVLLVLAAAVWFVNDKLNRLTYSDGKLPDTGEIPVEEPVTAEPDDTESSEEESAVIIDLAGTEEMEAQPLPETEVKASDDVLNILLLGTDFPEDNDRSKARADAILILSLNTKEHTARLVSLERGMGVPILGGRNPNYIGKYDWITHCFRYGGADLMLQEVQECFKVDVTHYVRFDFDSVTKIVDYLGGIDVDLTAAEVEYMWGGGHSYCVRDTGVNHLDGAAALTYARCRHVGSDWARIQRQRTVIQACADRVKNMTVVELNRVFNDCLPLVETNFTKTEILSLMAKAPGFLGVQFEQMTIPAAGTYGNMQGLGGRWLYAVDFETNAAILEEFLYRTKQE